MEEYQNATTDQSTTRCGRCINCVPKWFSFLMTNDKTSQKINTFIGYGRYPAKKVQKYNEGRGKESKTTKKGAPRWMLHVIVGPFENEDDAKDFAGCWRDKSRGIPSRTERGIKLAKERACEYWKEDKC